MTFPFKWSERRYYLRQREREREREREETRECERINDGTLVLCGMK